MIVLKKESLEELFIFSFLCPLRLGMIVYQKASVGVHCYLLLYLFKEKKEKKIKKQKEGIKFLKKNKEKNRK